MRRATVLNLTAGPKMKAFLSGLAFAVATIGSVQAQVPLAASPPVYADDPYSYRSVALTPSDAYKQGLINRWELERLEGPLPQAFQGPSPDGSRGFQPGGN